MAVVAEAPAVADPRQLSSSWTFCKRLGTQIQPPVLNILRHHQPLVGKQPVQAVYRHARLAGQPLRTQMLRLNGRID